MNQKTLSVNKPNILQVRTKRKFNLNVNIQRYTTDANGTILDNAAVPAALQISYPFHMFSQFDKNGGFAIGDSIVSPMNNTILFGVYTWGVNTPLFPFNALADINNQFKKGDVLFVYVDNLNAPNYFTFVRISALQGAYSSLVDQLNTTQLDNGNWGSFKIFDLQYTCIDEVQFSELMYLIETNFDSSFKYNSVVPLAYYHPEYKTGVNKIVIPFDAIANQFFGFASFINFNNSLLNLSFTVYA